MLSTNHIWFLFLQSPVKYLLMHACISSWSNWCIGWHVKHVVWQVQNNTCGCVMTSTSFYSELFSASITPETNICPQPDKCSAEDKVNQVTTLAGQKPKQWTERHQKTKGPGWEPQVTWFIVSGSMIKAVGAHRHAQIQAFNRKWVTKVSD